MEEEFMEQEEQTPEEGGYRPRPSWQVWAARIGVIVVLAAFLLYCWQIAMGGR